MWRTSWRNFSDGLETRIAEMLAVIDSDECPETAIGRHCKTHTTACYRKNAGDTYRDTNVMTFISGKKTGRGPDGTGILDISNIRKTSNWTLNSRSRKECVICGQPHIDTAEIKSFWKAEIPAVLYGLWDLCDSHTDLRRDQPVPEHPFPVFIACNHQTGGDGGALWVFWRKEKTTRSSVFNRVETGHRPQGSILVYYARLRKAGWKNWPGLSLNMRNGRDHQRAHCWSECSIQGFQLLSPSAAGEFFIEACAAGNDQF